MLESTTHAAIWAERLLEDLVTINSQTANVPGVEEVQQRLSLELRELGFNVRSIKNSMSGISTANLLIAELKGESPEFITMVSHADTVLAPFGATPFRKDATCENAFGSGVIDNKGGLVVALLSLKLYLQKLRAKGQRPYYSLRLVSSPNEETGSQGFHELFRHLSTDSALVLGFEPALDNGSIVEARRGNLWYNLKITGQEAHSGRCRGEELNAAHELALKIAKLHKLSDPLNGININIGHVSGGRDRYNVVCGFATAKIDVRFPDFESSNVLRRKIEAIFSHSNLSSSVTGQKTQSEFEIADDCPPFSATANSRKLVTSLIHKISKLESRVIRAEQAGGAGDVNHMSRPGLVVIDGLGPVGGGMHTVEEFISLPTLVTRAQAISLLLEESELLISSNAIADPPSRIDQIGAGAEFFS